MDSPHAEVRKTPGRGRGVFARERIRKGEEIATFDGKTYGPRSRAWETNERDILHHAIQFEQGAWRDSAGIARIVNHSCEPNCGIRDKWTLVAMRDIRPGEEVTWDYEMTEDSDWFRMRCRCGTKSCRKTIGAYRRMPEPVRKKYRGYVSAWLIEKYGEP